MIFMPGDGTTCVVNVAYIAANDFPREPGGTCAFCYGDPCAERAQTSARIRKYYDRNPHAVTCPMCHGRPT